MTKRRWLPLILLGVALMLAQVVAGIGVQAGANWLVYVPSIALAIAMVPWALGYDKGGRLVSLVAAGATMTIAILGAASVGLFFVPSGVLAAVAGWIGLRKRDASAG